MIIRTLIIAAILLLIYMTVWFFVAKRRKQLNVVDVAWGGGFVLVAWTVYILDQDARTLLIAVLVSLWGLRIMMHLGQRVLSGHEDPRYDEIRRKWRGNIWAKAYRSIFLLQGLLILLISLPVIMAANDGMVGALWMTRIGTLIWVVGFLIELTADAQLARFVRNRTDKNAVMETGLWRYSRHPNYFGEVVQWWAIGLIALRAPYGWIGLAGPLLLTILIEFVSGIPPIEKRKKSNPAYADYMHRTSRLVLWPPKF